MNKNKIKKAAYKSIVIDKKSHQETFDELRTKSKIELADLAEIVAKIPSQMKIQETIMLRNIFIVLLGVILILRVIGVIGLMDAFSLNPGLLILALAIGVLIPVVGIYGAIKAKVEIYFVVSMLFILGIVRSGNSGGFGNVGMNLETLLVFIPFIAAIVLGFIIPKKMKSEYSKKVVVEDVNGVSKKRLKFIFKDVTPASDDILDANL